MNATMTTALPSHTRLWNAPEGHVRVIVAEKNENPWRMWVVIGRGGNALNCAAQALGAITALALRHGADLRSVRNCLRGYKVCEKENTDQYEASSIADAIAQTLEELYPERMAPREQ